MSDWVLLGIVGLIVIYKLVDRWLDQRDAHDESGEHRATYSQTEVAYRDDARDDSERRIPDVQIGFRSDDA